MESIKLSHTLAQKLLITPQLKQALYILQLPLANLRTYLRQRTAENPLLIPCREKDLKAEVEKILFSHPTYSQSDKSGLTNKNTQASPLENIEGSPPTLQDYLQHQLKMTLLNDNELEIAEEIISYINNNGYLRESLETLSSNLKRPLEDMREALEIIQSLEPLGVGARNLQECLLIQLKNRELKDSLAYKIIESYFKELSRKRYDQIAKKLNVSLIALKEAIKDITSLNPKPGASFSQERTITIIPDAIIKKHNNGLKIELNERDLPKLKINNHYKKLLKDPNTSEEIKKFIRHKLKDAVWLIKTVEQRQKNVIKVIRQIAKIQKKALIFGISNTKPLTLKDIAQQTNLHLSTVARIVSNKYVSTPQGTIRSKDLFATKYASARGELYSDKNILAMIRDIIGKKDMGSPLTDQEISYLLSQKGICVSRRTITKYRNKLKIPPSFLR